MKNDSIIVYRRQMFLLFFSSIVIMILIFGVGVLLGKKLSAVSVNCDNPQQVISKSEKVNEKASTSPNLGGDSKVVQDIDVSKAEVQNKPSEKVESRDKEKASSGKASSGLRLQERVEKEQAKIVDKKPQGEKIVKKEKVVKPVAKDEQGQKVKRSSDVVDAKFTLQVGAFPDRSQALKIAAGLERKGYESWIQRGKSKDKDIFRVRIGKFSTKQDAEKFKQQFDKKEKLNSFITPLE